MFFRPLSLILLLALPATAVQEYDTFYEELDVILYQLQVNVQDKDGNPVKGLTKEDIQIRLSGDLQEIETVEEISLDNIIVQGTVKEAAAVPEQARRIFVLFFDLRYSKKGGIIAARDAAFEFVQTEMLPSDMLGIFVYNPLSGISMVTNFTSDQNHLLDALDTLGLSEMQNTVAGPSGYFLQGLLDDYQNRLQDAQSRAVQPTSRRGSFKGAALDYLLEATEKAALAEKRNYESEVRNFLGAFKAFADGLKYIRGRKNILWFSSGFDSSSLVGVNLAELTKNAERSLYGDIDRVSTDQLGRGDIQNLANQTVKALQGSGSVIFAVDTSRLDGLSGQKSGLQTLNFFSVDTGGRTYTNQNDLLPIMEEIQNITDHYYLVSFYPKVKKEKPGKIHNLKVKIDKPGVKIFANKGVLLDVDFRKMSKLEKQIQLAEFIGRDQEARAIPLEVGVMQTPMNEKLVKNTITVDVTGDYFLDTQKDKRAKRLEIFTFAFTGKTNEIFDQANFQFKLEPQKISEVLKENGVKYIADLFLAPGNYKLKVIARDMDTGKIGSSIQDLNVAGTEIELAGPTLLDQGKWVMLRESEELQARKKLGDLDFSYAYKFQDQDLIPSSNTLVLANQKASFFYLLDHVKDGKPTAGAVMMGPDNRPIQIPASALQIDYDMPKTNERLARVLLTVDLSQLNLKAGNDYKMLAQFAVPGKLPLRSVSDFKVVAK